LLTYPGFLSFGSTRVVVVVVFVVGGGAVVVVIGLASSPM
jgi:hypothetical protein